MLKLSDAGARCNPSPTLEMSRLAISMDHGRGPEEADVSGGTESGMVTSRFESCSRRLFTMALSSLSKTPWLSRYKRPMRPFMIHASMRSRVFTWPSRMSISSTSTLLLNNGGSSTLTSTRPTPRTCTPLDLTSTPRKDKSIGNFSRTAETVTSMSNDSAKYPETVLTANS